MAGARHSAVKVSSKDKYIAVGNVDDSGSVDYAATTPVIGVTWRLSPALNLYASAGKGFETPTMNELSYRAGASGPNFSLQPSRSDNLEIGVKALIGQSAQLNAAVFTVKTRDELVTLQNTGGRAVFQNVGGTRRNGLELSGTTELGNHFQAAVAYSFLNAWYAEAFRSCTGTPCAVPNTAVAAGNLIPGIPRSSLFAELSWRHPASGFMAVIDARRVSKVFVNDANTDAAEAYTVANVRLGFEQKSAGWTLKEFLRIDNLGDKKYSGSVIVNEGNSRFFEPAPERNYLVGITASYGF
jgi:iron complex outermembrane receptor protein